MSEAQQDIQGYSSALSATRQDYLALSSKRDEVLGDRERHSEFIKSLTVPFEEQFAIEPLLRGGIGRLVGKGAEMIGASERTVKALKDGDIIKTASSAISDAYGGGEQLVGNITGTHPAAKAPINDLPEGLIEGKNEGIYSGEIANPAFDSEVPYGTVKPSGLSQTGKVINSEEGNARISNVIEDRQQATNQLGQVHEQQMAELTNDKPLNQSSTDADNAEEASNRPPVANSTNSTGPKGSDLNVGKDLEDTEGVAVEEGEKDAGEDVAKSLLEDTAASAVGDEDPLGDVITAGLGIASLFATLFATKPKAPPPVQSINPSYQPGIIE